MLVAYIAAHPAPAATWVATACAGAGHRGQLLAIRAGDETVGAVRPTVDQVIKAGAKLFAATGAGRQTSLTETLAAGGAAANLHTVLLAAGAPHRTSRTDQSGYVLAGGDMVRPQMATTLAHTAMRTFYLATMTDGIPADRAGADVFAASAFPARPAACPAGCAIGVAAAGAFGYTTVGADDLLTGVALADTGITGDMAVAVNGQCRRFRPTGVTNGAL